MTAEFNDDVTSVTRVATETDVRYFAVRRTGERNEIVRHHLGSWFQWAHYDSVQCRWFIGCRPISESVTTFRID